MLSKNATAVGIHRPIKSMLHNDYWLLASLRAVWIRTDPSTTQGRQRTAYFPASFNQYNQFAAINTAVRRGSTTRHILLEDACKIDVQTTYRENIM